MSRQRDWQKKMIAEGRCTICGQTLLKHKYLCDDCQIRYNKRQRERRHRNLINLL